VLRIEGNTKTKSEDTGEKRDKKSYKNITISEHRTIPSMKNEYDRQPLSLTETYGCLPHKREQNK
jgi:stalled ribosome rescue protein Dom34